MNMLGKEESESDLWSQQRSMIKRLNFEGVSPKQIYSRFKNVYGGGTMSVQHVHEEDDLITIWEITAAVGIAYGTVRQIIHDDLHFWKIYVHLIPHTLTTEQKRTRVTMCRQNMVWFRREGNMLLK